jgi:hypothetical protein
MRIRKLIHAVLSVALWGLFFYYWHVVSQRELGYSTGRALLVLFGILVVAYSWTVFWILHNLRLARRFRNRRSARSPTAPDFSRDFLGRWVRINTITSEPDAKQFETLRRAAYVEIDSRAGTKLYSTFRRKPDDTSGQPLEGPRPEIRPRR